jgi:hypothetical protein
VLQLLVRLAIVGLVAGCSAAPAAEPQGFRIEHATGSIPPPYNHRYVIDASFRDEGVDVGYMLTYLYREGMTDQELVDAGYGPTDDISWTGRFGAEQANAWRAAARDAALGSPPEPMPGTDTFTVTVREARDCLRQGHPADRTVWLQVAREIDQAARAELGHPRSVP